MRKAFSLTCIDEHYKKSFAIDEQQARQGSSRSKSGTDSPSTFNLQSILVAILLMSILGVSLRQHNLLEDLRKDRAVLSTTGSPRLGSQYTVSDSLVACRNVPTMQDFNLQRFAGQWHQVAWSIPGMVDKPRTRTAQCMSANFTAVSSQEFHVTFTSMPVPAGSVRQGDVNAAAGVVQQHGAGATLHPGAPAKLQVELDSGARVPLWVVDTDYTGWALLYSCALQVGGMTPEQVFIIMSRSQVVDPMDVGDRLNHLASLQLPWKNVAFAPAHECSGMRF